MFYGVNFVAYIRHQRVHNFSSRFNYKLKFFIAVYRYIRIYYTGLILFTHGRPVLIFLGDGKGIGREVLYGPLIFSLTW